MALPGVEDGLVLLCRRLLLELDELIVVDPVLADGVEPPTPGVVPASTPVEPGVAVVPSVELVVAPPFTDCGPPLPAPGPGTVPPTAPPVTGPVGAPAPVGV